MLSFVKRLREKAEYHKSLEVSEGIIEYYKYDGFDEIAQCIEAGQPIEDIRGNYEAVKSMRECNCKTGKLYAYKWFFDNLYNNINTSDDTEGLVVLSEENANDLHCEINITASVHSISTIENTTIYNKIVKNSALKERYEKLKNDALDNWFNGNPLTKNIVKAEKFALNRLLYV